MTTSTSAQSVKPLHVLYEDDVLLAVDKPAGVPTQATLDKKRVHVYQMAQDLLKARSDSEYLALHHRLDKDTSGVLLFCKEKASNSAVGTMFKEHRFQKIYWALTVKKNRKDPWTIENFLDEQQKTLSSRMRMIAVKSGGKKAITQFRVLESYERGLLVEATPLTGRMHQIRVHLQQSGIPILGDDLYNSQKVTVPRMMLHAHQLIFTHPKTGQKVTITSPLPDDFKQVIAKL